MTTKRHTGYLFKRGKIFYLEYKIDGKRIVHALRYPDQKAICRRDHAEARRREIMAPLTVADKETALRSVAQQLDVVAAERRAAEDRNAPPPLQLSDAWAAYAASANRPDSGEVTLENYASQYGRFVRWMAKTHPDLTSLRDVTAEIAGDYAGDLVKSKLSANTFNKHVRVLELVFRVLEEKAGVTKNPWRKITRKKQNPKSRRELTVDELHKLCRNAEGEMRTLFALGLYTGLRRGDCCTLRWGEVDLKRGVIIRVPNKTARGKATPVRVPIHRVLKAILEERPAGKRGEYVLPEFADKYEKHRDRVTDLIQDYFLAQGIDLHAPGTGQRIVRKADGAPVCKDGGRVATADTGKRAVVEVGFHSLRHSFVSICRDAGAPLAVVEAIVGHSNPAMTRHYTHVGEVAAGQAVAALPAFGGEVAPVLEAETGGVKALIQDAIGELDGLKAKGAVRARKVLEKAVGMV